MKPTVLHDHYIVIDPDGDPVFKTITDELHIASVLFFNDSTIHSTKQAAIRAGYKLIKCDIVLTNIKEVI